MVDGGNSGHSPAPDLRLLGDLVLTGPTGQVALGGERQKRLLVALLIDRPRSVSRDRLAERVWSDSTRPTNPSAALRTYVSRVRLEFSRAGISEHALETTPGGYRLSGHGWDVDLDRFAALAHDSRLSTTDVALKQIDEALDLWLGRPFGDLHDEPWLAAEVAAFDELALSCRARRVRLLSDLGRNDEAIVDARHLIDQHPWRESAVAGLMVALYRSGRAADSVQAYQHYRERLDEALGLEPGPELRSLEQQVLANDPGLYSVDHSAEIAGYALLVKEELDGNETRWKAEHRSLGRDVTVRRIGPDLADDPDFVRGFSARVRGLARVRHPNLVPIHDSWREPGAAWIVGGWIDGDRLDRWLVDAAVTILDVARLCRQIGGALTAMHAASIVHGDVSGRAVIVDEGRDFHLTDFRASPMADGQPADVVAFAHVMRSAVDQIEEDLLPPVLREDVSALLGQAIDAPPAAATVTARLLDVLDQESDSSRSVRSFRSPRSDSQNRHVENPYRGLRPFDEVDKHVFHGRENFVESVLRRLTTHRLVAVVGASGSGKSSVVRAGVIPSLRQRAVGTDRVTGSFITTMTPGASPVRRLLSAVDEIALRRQPGLDTEDQRDRPGAQRSRSELPVDELVDLIRTLLPVGPSVIVVDQFEEAFVLAPDEERNRFLELIDLLTGPQRDDLDVRVLATIRADHWDRPLGLSGLGSRLAEGALHLSAMAPDEIEAAITKPAAWVGCRLEGGLVSRLISDADTPGALPLLQYALTELHDRRDGDLLTHRAYDDFGGIAGSVAAATESIHRSLDEDGQLTMRRLMGRLAFVDGAVDTRRRVERADLAGEGLDDILNRLGRARLVTFDADPVSRAPTVEFAHESLLRSWARLRTWLNEDRLVRQRQQDLEVAARRWEQGGHLHADLLRGARLEEALDLVAARDTHDEPSLNPAARRLLDASVAVRDAEKRREFRRARRLRSILAVTVVLLGFALIAGGVALGQRGRAISASDEATAARASAETRRMVASVGAATETSSELGLLIAAAAYRRDPGPETLGGLQQAFLRTGPFLGLFGSGTDYLKVEWAPPTTDIDTADETDGPAVGPGDGRIFALRANGLDVLDVASGRVTALVDVNTTGGMAVHPDGTMVAISTGNGVLLVDPATGSTLDRLDTQGFVATMDFDAEGDRIVTGGRDGWIRVWSVDDAVPSTERVHAHPERHGSDLPPEVAFPEGARHEPLTMPVGVTRVRFSPDGGTVVTTGGIFVRSFDSTTLAPTGSVALDREAITAEGRVPAVPTDIAFGGDGSVFVATGQAVQLLNLEAGRRVDEYLAGSVPGTLPNEFDLDIVPGSGELVTLLRSGELNVLDPSTGDSLVRLDTGLAGRPILSPDVAVDTAGRRAAVVGGDGVRLIALDGSGLINLSLPQPEWARFVQISDDGRWLMWAALDRPPAFVDLATGDRSTVAMDDLFLGSMTALGSPFVFERGPNELTVLHELDPASMTPTGVVSRPLSVWGSDPSPDGRWVAVGSIAPEETTIRILDRTNLEEVRRLSVPDVEAAGVIHVGWSPESDRLAASFVGRNTTPFVIVFDVNSGEPVSPQLTQAGFIHTVGFSPDGRHLLTGDLAARVVVRDADTFQPTGHEFQVGTGSVESEYGRPFDFSDDGRYLLSTIGEPRLVETGTWEVFGEPFPSDEGFRLSAARGGRFLPTSIDGRSVIWWIEPDRWADVACQAAGRNLTTAEWTRFGPAGEPYGPPCPVNE